MRASSMRRLADISRETVQILDSVYDRTPGQRTLAAFAERFGAA